MCSVTAQWPCLLNTSSRHTADYQVARTRDIAHADAGFLHHGDDDNCEQVRLEEAAAQQFRRTGQHALALVGRPRTRSTRHEGSVVCAVATVAAAILIRAVHAEFPQLNTEGRLGIGTNAPVPGAHAAAARHAVAEHALQELNAHALLVMPIDIVPK